MRGLLTAMLTAAAVMAQTAMAGAVTLIENDPRVALFRLAMPELAEEAQTVLTALEGRPALMLQDADVDFATLSAELRTHHPDAIGPDGLRTPLIVGADARLRLRQGDAMLLDRSAGAFLIVFGALHVTGARVAGSGASNLSAPDFAPFVMVGGRGQLHAKNARFADLGFGWQPAFGGVAVMAQALFARDSRANLSDSTFTRVRSVAISGAGTVRVTGARFTEMGRSALILGRVTGAVVADSVFEGGHSGDAIRLMAGAAGTVIRAVTITAPAENGITLMPGTRDTRITDTTITDARHNGIRADQAACLQVAGTQITGSRFSGINLRAASGVTVENSRIAHSRHAGIKIADLPADATTRVTGARIAHNRAGLETAAPGRVALHRNDFQDQFPRFLAGDIQAHTPRILRDLSNQTPLLLRGGGVPVLAQPSAPCPLNKAH